MNDLADTILALDRYQSNHEGARRCKVQEHGRLTAHPSGSVLICGVCGDGVKVTKDLLAEAFKVR